MNLSRLEKVELREVWKHEATYFTNWLARPENLELLSDEIGIGISLIQTEASVGNFNVDILAEEEDTGKKIVIENQLEPTNHDHLGKIITYASGFDAETIIWIVKNVRDEHKQAIDWLNEHTDSGINIFAIEMEVWRIGDSPYAPKFNIIAKPNDWAKTLRKSAVSTTMTDTKMFQLEFWTNLKDYIKTKDAKIRLRKARAQHWYDISIGSSLAHISLTLNSKQRQIGCELYINDSKELYSYLVTRKSELESRISPSLEWQELPNKKASRIKLISDLEYNEHTAQEEYYDWFLKNIITFQKVFPQIVNEFQKIEYPQKLSD